MWSPMATRGDDLDRLFSALGDPTRRRILERLDARAGLTTGELAAAVPGLTRYAVMKHLEVLRRAGLVQTLPEGRRRRHYPIEPALEPVTAWLARRPRQRSPG